MFGQIRFGKIFIDTVDEFCDFVLVAMKTKEIWDKSTTVNKVLLFVGLTILVVDCDSITVKLCICCCGRILEFFILSVNLSDPIWSCCFLKFISVETLNSQI